MNTKIYCDIAEIDMTKKFNKKNSQRFYDKSINEKSWSKNYEYSRDIKNY